MTDESTSRDVRHYEERLLEIEAKLDKLSTDVEDLVSAWKAANWLVGFVKWAGGLATAIVALYTLLKMKA